MGTNPGDVLSSLYTYAQQVKEKRVFLEKNKKFWSLRHFSGFFAFLRPSPHIECYTAPLTADKSPDLFIGLTATNMSVRGEI